MRFVRFHDWLSVMGSTFFFDRLVYEEVRRHAGTSAAHVYGGFVAVLTCWAEGKGIPFESIPVGTIKKFATGKGNAGKDEMVAAAQAWGYKPKDDNEADALCLLRCALAREGAGALK
jgi:Holliday junction resolvasome RuvABC endonuclease subunit